MHEMSLAMSIVEQTRQAAAREGAARVLEVEVEVGALAGVMTDALSFCLEAVGPVGGLPETVFRIIEVHGEGLCRKCGKGFAADSYHTNCSYCGSEDVYLHGGRDLKLRSFTIED